METILITGGTGLLGSFLASFFHNEGYRISILSRQTNLNNNYEVFHWNPDTEFFDKKALENADYIINLAGTNIFRQRWNQEEKEKILHSRTNSTRLLANMIEETHSQPKAIISASAIGFYGNTMQEPATEDWPQGKGFLAEVCNLWEKEALLFEKCGLRTIRLRIGIVLSTKGGMIQKLISSFKYRLMPIPGKGTQMLSWIHIEDLARLSLFLLKQENIQGPLNAVAPNPLNYTEMISQLGTALEKPTLNLHFPKIFFKILMGESAEIILNSSLVSNKRAENLGFRFLYPHFYPALLNLLKTKK